MPRVPIGIGRHNASVPVLHQSSPPLSATGMFDAIEAQRRQRPSVCDWVWNGDVARVCRQAALLLLARLRSEPVRSEGSALQVHQRSGAIRLPARIVPECGQCRGCESVLRSLHQHSVRVGCATATVSVHRVRQRDTSRSSESYFRRHFTSDAAGIDGVREQSK